MTHINRGGRCLLFLFLCLLNTGIISAKTDAPAADIPAFAAVILMASLISCIVGMVLGIFAKNQVSAGTVITPVLMVFMLIPMFADLIEALEKISQFTFTGIVMETMMRMMEGDKSLITAQGMTVMAAEAALAVVLFIWLYKRNGFERE